MMDHQQVVHKSNVEGKEYGFKYFTKNILPSTTWMARLFVLICKLKFIATSCL